MLLCKDFRNFYNTQNISNRWVMCHDLDVLVHLDYDVADSLADTGRRSLGQSKKHT